MAWKVMQYNENPAGNVRIAAGSPGRETMKTVTSLFGAAVAVLAFSAPALSQDTVTLRVHQMLPAQATIPAKAIEPWAQRVEEHQL